MSDFHDDITQIPTPPTGGTSSGGDPDRLTTGNPDANLVREGEGATPVVDREAMRQRLREDRGATQANEGAPAEAPPSETPPAEAPPAEAPPAEAPPAEAPPAETPSDPPTTNETPTQTDTPKTEREIYDEMIRDGLEVLAPKNPYGATFEETDPLYLAGLENPDEVMSPIDEDGRPIDTGDDDFGFGGMH